MTTKVAIIADPEGKGYEFAKGVDNYLLTKRERDFPVYIAETKTTSFRDTEYKIKINQNIRRKICFFIHDANKTADTWYLELMQSLYAIKYSSPSEINVVFPYMRFSRQDRKDESRVSVNAAMLAETVSKYATRCMTVDLHNPQTQMFFENIPMDNLYSFPTLITHLQRNHPEILENLVVVSPDAGGGKRAEYLVKMLGRKGIYSERIIGQKERKKEDHVEKITIQGNIKKRNCLILDDIIDTGDTMIKTGQQLKKQGAANIYAYGTHGFFTKGTKGFNIFKKVFVSNTIKSPRVQNIEVISLVPLFGEAIYRTIMGESLSSLFDE